MSTYTYIHVFVYLCICCSFGSGGSFGFGWRGVAWRLQGPLSALRPFCHAARRVPAAPLDSSVYGFARKVDASDRMDEQPLAISAHMPDSYVHNVILHLFTCALVSLLLQKQM